MTLETMLNSTGFWYFLIIFLIIIMLRNIIGLIKDSFDIIWEYFVN